MSDRRRGGLLPVFLVVLVDLIGFGIVLPLLPFYAKDLGASAFQIGWLFSIYSIAQMVASPLWGSWSDRVGRRPVMLISTLAASGAYTAFAFSHSFSWLFMTRLAAGLAGGNIAAAQAYVADVTPPEGRAKGMGVIGAAFGIGFAVGPALSVLLLQPFWGASTARPYLLPGLFAAGMSFLSFLFVCFRLPESLDRSRAGSTAIPRGGSAAIWNAAFWGELFGRGAAKGSLLPMLWGAAGALAFAQSSLYGAFPLFCAARYGLDARGIGSVYVLMGAVAVLVQGGAIRVLVKSFSEKDIFLAGAALLTVSLLAMPWMGRLGLFTGMLAVMTLGASLCTPTLSSLISKAAPAGTAGEALGRAQGMSGLGRAVGPSWGGWLYGLGPALPFMLTGLLLAPAVFLGLRLRSKKEL